MTVAELTLACIVVAALSAYTFLLRLDPRRNALVFLLSCVTGFAAQLALGRELNLYTPNIAAYISFVSVAVIVTWGVGMTSVYALHLWIARALRIQPGPVLFFLCGVPVIVALEFTGSNVVHMKLHNYRDYAPLMPQFNAMHAPPWLYGYYVIIQILFYGLLKALNIEKERPNRVLDREAGQRVEAWVVEDVE